MKKLLRIRWKGKPKLTAEEMSLTNNLKLFAGVDGCG
jgi:hypothetical protein